MNRDAEDQGPAEALPLLTALTAEQATVIDLIGDVWVEHRRWPLRGYLEHEMDRQGSDLTQVLASFVSPHLSRTGPPPRAISPPQSVLTASYSAVWYDRVAAVPNQPVGLTVAGIGLLAVENQTANEVFLHLLRDVVEQVQQRPLDPFDSTTPEVSLSELAAQLKPEWRSWVALMPDIFDHEPATWGGRVSGPHNDLRWRHTRDMRHFVGVSDLDDYLTRISTYLAAPVHPVPLPTAPTLDLPASLDFLHTVWLLVYGTSLVQLPSAQIAASLATDASTAAEFDAHLSGLVQVLKGFAVPPPGKHPVARLKSKLLHDLPTEAHPIVDRAIETLEAVSAVRDGGQHVKATPKAVAALRVFGLDYPVVDWQLSWEAIRNGTARALTDLREELLAHRRDADLSADR